MKAGKRLLSPRLVVAGCVLVCSAVAAQDRFESVRIVPPDEDELLLCALYLSKVNLSDELETYNTERGMLLPLGEICRCIEFNIDVDAINGRATGWLADPSHPFMLDMAAQTVLVDGYYVQYDPARVQAHENDIFVESSLLGEWLGIPIEVNKFFASVVLKPREKLPIQLRMEREARGSNVHGYGISKREDFPRVAESFKALGGISLDLSVSRAFDIPGAKQDLWESPHDFGFLMSGDVLWMNGYLGLGGGIGSEGLQIKTVSGVLRRIVPEGTLLGPLHAREITIGDILPVSSVFLGHPEVEPSIVVGNYPLTVPDYFDLQTLQGYLLPGWDVELYRNGSFLDYRKSSAEGAAYKFENIPLLFGRNELLLIFHGPTGQTKTETHVYNVGTNMVSPGTFSYRSSITLEDLGLRFGFQQTFGLSKSMTVNCFFISRELIDGRNTYAGLGFAGYFGALQADASAALDTGHSAAAADIGVRTQIGRTGLSYRAYMFGTNWEMSEQSGTKPPYSLKSLLRIDNLYWSTSKMVSPLTALHSLFVYQDGTFENQIQFIQQLSLRPVLLRNVLTLDQKKEISGANCYQIDGSMVARHSFDRVSVDAELNYGLFPLQNLTASRLSWNTVLPWKVTLSGNAGYDYINSVISIGAMLYRDVSPLKMSIAAQWTSSSSLSISLSASTNLSIDDRTKKLVSDSRPLATLGSISARAFLDRNYDGIFDEGDEPLEGVGFLVNSRSQDTLTGPNGVAFLRGLLPNVVTNVSISLVTLEDLLMVPVIDGLSCVPRPGYAVCLDFPVWLTGEITGTIYIEKNGEIKAAAGVQVYLIDEKGNVVKQTRSAYDGYYAFEKVLAGAYSVCIKGQQSEPDRIDRCPSRAVTIPPEGGYFDYVDLTYQAEMTQ